MLGDFFRNMCLVIKSPVVFGYIGIVLPSYAGTITSFFQEPQGTNQYTGLSLVGFDHFSHEKPIKTPGRLGYIFGGDDITVWFYLEYHPSGCKWLITVVIVRPVRIGLWDPFQMA